MDDNDFDGVPVWEAFQEPEVSGENEDNEVHVHFLDQIYESIHGTVHKQRSV